MNIGKHYQGHTGILSNKDNLKNYKNNLLLFNIISNKFSSVIQSVGHLFANLSVYFQESLLYENGIFFLQTLSCD